MLLSYVAVLAQPLLQCLPNLRCHAFVSHRRPNHWLLALVPRHAAWLTGAKTCSTPYVLPSQGGLLPKGALAVGTLPRCLSLCSLSHCRLNMIGIHEPQRLSKDHYQLIKAL